MEPIPITSALIYRKQQEKMHNIMNIEWKHLFSDITLIRETLQYKEKKILSGKTGGLMNMSKEELMELL